jgi:hypothetical protein
MAEKWWMRKEGEGQVLWWIRMGEGQREMESEGRVEERVKNEKGGRGTGTLIN